MPVSTRPRVLISTAPSGGGDARACRSLYEPVTGVVVPVVVAPVGVLVMEDSPERLAMFDRIKRIVDGMPPLSDEQLSRLAVLLRPGGAGE